MALFVLFAGVLTGVFCAVFWALKPGPSEPQYQGKKLTAWMGEIDSGFFAGHSLSVTNRQESELAVAAIRQIGTNALPVALELIRAKDSWFRSHLAEWIEQYDGDHWPARFPIYIKLDWEKNFEGVNIIWALGDEAKPIIPDLIRLLRSQDRETVEEAKLALPGVGTNAIPPLLQLLNDSDKNVRLRAAIVLGDFFSPKMPLTKSDGSLIVAGSEDFRSQASAAVLVLLQSLDDQKLDSVTRSRAIHALGLIREDAPTVVPVLIQHIQSETNGVAGYITRGNYFWALGCYGTNAESAVPMLVNLLKPMIESSNENDFPFVSPLVALQKINPEAARPFMAEWKAHLSGASR